ncbi:DUF4190 domain-containing protein [Nocardioides sp. cx-169]|uniref:DUF4190 domain-containing protein n=1 Tax=Nocardioides sp. cx-169 TaxID=2899080 RepID=UPI001E35575E|nr:DUF4190 domain-containing protein [Nocardioides sp. cx-169]MCD4533520.1 DUF4190 domain-containing protein [Nocardioides sp. cx-169]
MTNQGPDDSDQTQPFASPSGPEQPSAPQWPTYGQPSEPTPEPPATAPPPSYGAPGPPHPYLQQPYGQPPYPPNFVGYGQPVPGYSYAQPLGQATTSMVLGIIGIVSILLTPMCCLTFPGVFVGPFAIWTGASARRTIDRNPGAYTNRGQAVAGFITGIVATVLAVLAVIVVVAFVGMTDWTSSYDGRY